MHPSDTMGLAYIEAAYFTDAESDMDMATECEGHAWRECEAFLSSLSADTLARLLGAVQSGQITLDQIGHDLWLTRNGHGTGFWDRGLGELGDALTDAAHAMGEELFYMDEDGLLHFG